MATEQDYQRLFEGLRGRGELATLYDGIRGLRDLAEGELRKMLRQKMLRSAEEWATFQHQQGKLAAYHELVAWIDTHAQLPSARKPTRRLDPGEPTPEG